MITTVIIDKQYGDTAATHIAAILSNRGGAEVVSLSDFLVEAGVNFDGNSGNLHWDQAVFHTQFPDAPARRICNRVVGISMETVTALDEHQEVLSSNLVFHSYARILQEFAQVWGVPGIYSPVGNLLPLNLQWHRFNTKISDIGTPRFVYGFGFQKVDVHDFQQPIWKSPFDLYGWKPAEELNVNRIHPFVVDRPVGDPLVLYFAGDSAEVFALGPQRDVDERTKERLIQCTGEIKNMFGAFMGEALFFADEKRLTFAAFSHYLKTSIGDTRLPEVLERGLARLDA